MYHSLIEALKNADLLTEKLSFKHHDHVENLLDQMVDSGESNQTKNFKRLYEFVQEKYLTCRELQQHYPHNAVLNHNTDLFALCATSVVYAKEFLESQKAS